MADKPHPAGLKATEELLLALVTALEAAPHKHRIDFQAYWDWYDGPRAEAAERAHAFLRDLGAVGIAKLNSTG